MGPWNLWQPLPNTKCDWVEAHKIGCITILKLNIPTIGVHFEQNRNCPPLLTPTKNVFLVSHLTLERMKAVAIDNIKTNLTKDLMKTIRNMKHF